MEATWVWADAASDAPAHAAFAAAQGVREAFVNVPWEGPDAATRALRSALSARGIRVAALGGDRSWAARPEDAAAWAARVGAGWSGIHLDIEPWACEEWPADAVALLDGLVAAVRGVQRTVAGPVEIDLPGWLARDHPDAFEKVVRRAAGVSVMAYRDRAADILADASAARAVAVRVGRRYRIAVNTRADPDASTTFRDDGRAVLERECRGVAGALRADAAFAGIAVHDLASWRALGP